MDTLVCKRCGGLSIREDVPLHMETKSNIKQYRCINCGDVIDEQMVINKLLNKIKLYQNKGKNMHGKVKSPHRKKKFTI